MRLRRVWHSAPVVAVVLFGALGTAKPLAQARGVGEPRSASSRLVSRADRDDALARARIWRAPTVAISRARLAVPVETEMTCRFVVSRLGGTTPKFDCERENGERLRIKYGKGAEIPSEAAATRLVAALGFGADEITLVRRLRCYGCPVEPFVTMKAVDLVRAERLYASSIDKTAVREFDWVAMERKYDAWPIETAAQEGWALHELDRIDEAKGGAPREQVDALRLLAVFLAHWDNKAENQRLVCRSRTWREGQACAEPALVLQDLGATFGPHKVDLEGWRKAAIWSDRATCRLTMRDLPYEGATFKDVRIGEAGRRFLASRLAQLSTQQIAALFTAARFDQKRGIFSGARPAAEWVAAFQARVRMVSEGPPCPPV